MPNEMTLAERVARLSDLLKKLQPVPSDWLSASGGPGGSANPILECVPCSSYEILKSHWLKAFEWPDGVDRTFTNMLASILSTRSVGDQLWFRVEGPPSTGKTTLGEALAVNRKHVFPIDTLTGLTSGYQTDAEGKKNHSLVLKLKNKTLLVMDGDTLLSLDNLKQVLSQLRAFYGRNIRSQYKNKMSADHEGISTTVIICGTSSLRSLDSSELGERTLTSMIVDSIDSNLEDMIARRAALRAVRELDYIYDGRAESRDTPEMVVAKQLTGGYIDHLVDNANMLLSGIAFPEWAIDRCALLAKFVSYSRARPAKRQEGYDVKAQREMTVRLTSQHVRLAKCLAVVLNKSSVDQEVMRRVSLTSLDTASGRTLDLTRLLTQMGSATEKSIALRRHESEEKERTYLRFLLHLGVVQLDEFEYGPYNVQMKWRLTDNFGDLYRQVVEG